MALACYWVGDPVVTLTPRLLTRPDCRIRFSLAHEYRHSWQERNGKFEAWDQAQIDADADAFARPFGC